MKMFHKKKTEMTGHVWEPVADPSARQEVFVSFGGRKGAFSRNRKVTVELRDALEKTLRREIYVENWPPENKLGRKNALCIFCQHFLRICKLFQAVLKLPKQKNWQKRTFLRLENLPDFRK